MPEIPENTGHRPRHGLRSRLVVRRIGLDGVVAAAPIDPRIRRAIDGIELVIAIVTKELIRSETTDNTVVTGAAMQDVAAAAAGDRVSATPAIDGRGKRDPRQVHGVVTFA